MENVSRLVGVLDVTFVPTLPPLMYTERSVADTPTAQACVHAPVEYPTVVSAFLFVPPVREVKRIGSPATAPAARSDHSSLAEAESQMDIRTWVIVASSLLNQQAMVKG